MASKALFDGIPAFSQELPTVPMSTISLSALLSRDAETAQLLLTSCQQLGFFFLDLNKDSMGEIMMGEIDQLFRVCRNLMDLPDGVKWKHKINPPHSFLGFKTRGGSRTETGEQDRFEMFNVAQDGLMDTSQLQPLPDILHSEIGLLTSFMKHSQLIMASIHQTLASQLSLPEDAFSSLQTPTKASGTVLRLIRSFASPHVQDQRTSMIHHTDFGTITLLANLVGGLQVLNPGGETSDESAWRWVRPQPGLLIVNLGDVMVQWTGGLLRSNIHRIRYPPGSQKHFDRYSIAVVGRPDHDASMKRKMGPANEHETELTAREWEVKRFMSYAHGKKMATSQGGITLQV